MTAPSVPIRNKLSTDRTPGYHGRYLHIDLSSHTAEAKLLSAETLRAYIGGAGLGTRLLLDGNSAEVDALDPASAIAFVFSPLVGSPLTTSAKFAVVAKSPLTGRLNDSLASSRFAISGKRTGFDAILLTGRAASRSVVCVRNLDGELSVAVEPAGGIWGLECGETQRQLSARYGKDWSSAVIGPAGEALVPFSTISHDGRHAGRGGSGAVLGAKNVKALLVQGDVQCEWADAHGLNEFAKRLSRASFGPATEKYRELGTATNLLVFNRLRTLPTRNFQQGSFEGVEKLAPETLSQTREKTRAYCAACTIGCEHIYSLGDESNSKVRLEYENLFALGPMCGIDDSDVVLKASERCDQLGLDTISVGGTIAFAMECVERDYLPDADWLRFGSGDALLKALDLIVQGEGVGRLLRVGSRLMAQEIGRDSLEFAPQVKGMEIPGYEPRGLQTMALGFATVTRGADHNRSGAYEFDFSDQVDRRQLDPQSAALAIQSEDQAALIDALILCKFLRGVFADVYAESAEALNLVTGWDLSADEMREVPRRIVTARKWFNVRAGWAPGEDTLPTRFFAQTAADSDVKVDPAALAEAIQTYNRLRGWTAEGWISDETLTQYGLNTP